MYQITETTTATTVRSAIIFFNLAGFRVKGAMTIMALVRLLFDDLNQVPVLGLLQRQVGGARKFAAHAGYSRLQRLYCWPHSLI